MASSSNSTSTFLAQTLIDAAMSWFSVEASYDLSYSKEFILVPRQTQKEQITYLNLTILYKKEIDSFPYRRIKTSLDDTRQTKDTVKVQPLTVHAR